MHRCLSALLCLLLSAPAAAQVPDARVLAGIDRAIEARMAERGAPGLSAAVGTGDAVAWQKGYGYADLENRVPATEDTVYRLASISKPITAVAVLRLWERGELDLDADVRTYVEAWPEKRWVVTCRHLLGHLGGVPHYGRGGTPDSATRFSRVAETLHFFADRPLLHEPGTAYRYTTYGYNLLGAAAEAAAGRDFVQVLREEVFVPAGTTALQDDDSRRIIPHRAQGYVRSRSGVLRNSKPVDISYKVPGGGLCSTAGDLVRFAQAVRAGRLVKVGTRDLMWTPMKTVDGKPTGYGMGWRIAEHDGRRAVWHTGAQSRVSTVLYLLPDEEVEVALLCNLEGERLLALARRIAADVSTARAGK